MPNESLKFAPKLVPLLLSGEKTCTWRLWDDKNIQVGDIVDLISRPEIQVFAHALITSIVTKLMGELTPADKEGHEPFESEEQMYTTYSRYYGKSVDEATPLTVYHFKLVQG